MDWERFERLTIEHRVVSIVYDILIRLKAEGLLPSEFLNRYSNLNRHLQLDQLCRVKELLEISKAFDLGKIRFMTLKGPAVSQQLYSDAAKRHCGDIDLLVLKEDFCKVPAVLGELGYVREGEAFDERVERGEPFELLSHHEHYDRGRSRVEVHWRLSSLDFMFSDSVEVLYARKSAVLIGGQVVPILGEGDLVDYLTLHGTAHCWHRLKWLCDIVKSRNLGIHGSQQSGLVRAIAVRNRLIEGLLCDARNAECTRFSRFLADLSLSQIVEDQLGPDSFKKVLLRSFTVFACILGTRKRVQYVTALFSWPEFYKRFPLPKYLRFLYCVFGPIYWGYRKIGDRFTVSDVSSR